MIEKGRHLRIKPENRFCPFCNDCVEDEMHFLLTCPKYNDIRTCLMKTFENEDDSFHLLTVPEKFKIICCSTEHVNIVGNYIHKAFDIRASALLVE